MASNPALRLHYHDSLLARARRGDHNYTNRLRAAVESVGIRLVLDGNSLAEQLASAASPDFTLFHMDAPLDPAGLTTRLAYFYPFWRIERSARRWEWSIARADFAADEVDPQAAAAFCRRLRARHLAELDAPADECFVLVPLQGRLLTRRSFQTMSPMAMLAETLRRSGGRRVVATLHPRETYSPAELKALDDLERAEPGLTVRKDAAEALLPRCSMVVTQNSAVALQGFALSKPAILFARIDFHHIAANVASLGLDDAFARATETRPDFERYLFWFLKLGAINAGAPEAETQILAAMSLGGWDI